jgi:hypothetical protein
MQTDVKLGLAPVLELRRAETVLHDVARQLARVPPRGAARELHLRALGYKRAMATWSREAPERVVVERTIAELLALRQEARLFEAATR